MKESEKIYVETKYVNFDGLLLENGYTLSKVQAAYETYGKLTPEKDNAILIAHAFSGDAHAAHFHKGAKKPGWWDTLIGPGKAFDTDKYFIICSNSLGGCKGTTGPNSLNPFTNEPYALDFPLISIKDMVNLQKKLIDYLGIPKLLTVSGGSMGGMQALQWAISYPEYVKSVIPIATTLKHSPQQIAFNEVGRQAIMADPNWNDGNYYGNKIPKKGLSVARMVGHITYMSDISMMTKFGRKYRDAKKLFKFDRDFEVEGYLEHQGTTFVERFDANSYLYLSKAIDYFDITENKSPEEIFQNVKSIFLVISFNSDWLYPPYQSEEIVNACRLAGIDVTYNMIDYSYGHDSFLIETEKEAELIRDFLSGI
jgi:homoserine O-acetyltransferase/O-succinyltransferase